MIASPIEIVTTDTGFFKPGLRGRILDAAERTVYLGPNANTVETRIAEYTVEIDPVAPGDRPWRKEFCQYGRDFVFFNAAT